MNQYKEILFSLVVIVFIFYNQLRVRQVKSDTKFILPLILFILGINNFKNYIGANDLTVISWISIITSLTLLAFGMAAIRATSLKLWVDNNIVYRQGTWITILLWIVSVTLHEILNRIGHVGQATSLIYFAITFSVQKLIVQKRARAIYVPHVIVGDN